MKKSDEKGRAALAIASIYIMLLLCLHCKKKENYAYLGYRVPFVYRTKVAINPVNFVPKYLFMIDHMERERAIERARDTENE